MNIAIAVVLLLLALAVAIGTRPNTFRVERSALIGAPPSAIFPYVNDFHLWNRWSPFEKKVISLVSSMDKMVGSSFAEGLANLKTVAEREARS